MSKLPSGQTRVVSPAIVECMLTRVNNQSREALMEAFGISYNTWRKVRAGDPIRTSVAERLEQRVEQNRL